MAADQPTDRRVITCNYLAGTKVVAKGAKAHVATAFLGGNLPERVYVVVCSRGGRWIEKWESVQRLGNFRPTTLAADNPRYANHWLQSEATEKDVAALVRSRTEVTGGFESPDSPGRDTSESSDNGTKAGGA